MGDASFSIQWGIGAKNGRSLSRLGNTVLPSRMTARWDFPKDHSFEFDILVERVQFDGSSVVRPTCEAIRIERNPECPPLSGAELRRVPVKNWVEFACVQAAMRGVPGQQDAWEPVETEEERAHALKDIQESTRRRRITPELLTGVAAVLLEHEGDVLAVADAYDISNAQAYRYVKMARERGYLEGE